MSTRVHILAKELGVKSKAIVEKCKAEGLTAVTNHMSTLSAGLEATVREWFSEGAHTTTEERSERVNLDAVKEKPKRRSSGKSKDTEADAQPHAGDAQAATATHAREEASAARKSPETLAAERSVDTEQHVGQDDQAAAQADQPEPDAAVAVAEPPEQSADSSGTAVVADDQQDTAQADTYADTADDTAGDTPPQEAATAVAEPSQPESDIGEQQATQDAAPTADASDAAATSDQEVDGKADVAIVEQPAQEPPKATPPAKPPKPLGPQNVPAPAKLQGPRVIRVEKPERDQVDRAPYRDSRPSRAASAPTQAPGPAPDVDERGGKGKRKGRSSTESEESARRKSRLNPRRSGRSDSFDRIREWRDRDLIERKERLAQADGHVLAGRSAQRRRRGESATPGRPAARKTKVEISEPIMLKDFCAAIAVPFNRILPKLIEQGEMATINQTISADLAELIALEFGVELTVKRQTTQYEQLKKEFEQMEPDKLVQRAPIVTFLGHVDHGKTSLLDAIRKTKVTDTEAGGITQHIGAYRLDNGDEHVVFLDTPGHEAFTAMRARGANMTDVVVLVVAADDGVMPQTIEAINHAKAAGVPIVVALNKIDLPNRDEQRILGQLAEHNLIAQEWGGEVDVIRTSATTGQGIDDLVSHLNTLSELLELQSDPGQPVAGTVIEAELRPEGAVARIMVQQGTLERGNVLVAGHAYGRIRAIRDHTGKVIDSAGPATPVEVLGLDEVPTAGDRVFQVEDLQRAKDIAEERRADQRQSELAARRKTSLEGLFEQMQAGEAVELCVIIKADVQGSVDVLREQLGNLQVDEVQVRVLHAGVGGITEGDVLLADASDAIIIGFGVVPEERARIQADDLGVQIRQYTIIYQVLDDVKQAMAGLLEPEFEYKTLGQALVREIFNIPRVGTIAGCQVTQGIISRSAKVRVIRDSVIVRDGASLNSLRRFKDDAREVRQGLECGIKIEGFDDIKPGDVIEAFEMVEVQRTF